MPLHIFFTTVCLLCATPKSLGFDLVQVSATITQYRLEKDGDIHLILEDSGCTMIAEIIPGSPLRKMFKATSHWKKCGKRMNIMGTDFFDHEHGQRGAAPNGIEIPVLYINPPDTVRKPGPFLSQQLKM